MKTKLFRIICLCLCAAYFLFAFGGCNGNGEDTSVQTDKVTESDIITTEMTDTEEGYTLPFSPASPGEQTLTADGHSPQILISNYNETATDALGRTLPTAEQTGYPKEGKYVGLFYLIWHNDEEINRYGTGMRDITKAYACNPESPDLGGAMTWGWWAEPEVGYFRSDDVWKIRRDMDLFSMAGVDFLYIDMTNGYMYQKEFTLLLDTMLAMRAEGRMTPYIVPWCNSHASEKTEGDGVAELYRLFYQEEKYNELWFYWYGKPLVFIKQGNDSDLSCVYSKKLNDFFTFRVCWIKTRYPRETDDQQKNYKVWADCQLANFDDYVYGYYKDPNKAECVAIGAAGWCEAGRGKSGKYSTHEYLDRFLQTETMGEGIMLEDCFQKVMENNPETEVLLISRWNEWMALHLGKHDLGYVYTEFGYMDTFNAEFTRDLEPMKGGYTDNYFYQMCSIIRRFKGVLPQDKSSGKQTVDISGNFDVWQNVSPVFTDYINDIMARDSTDITGKTVYQNFTGRNDIIQSRVTTDGGMIYFYVKTAETITSYKGAKNWMLLFVDSDNNKKTGWEGFDYLINYSVADDNITAVCVYKSNIWQETGLAKYKVKGSEMMIAVPRSLLGLTNDAFTIDFHWVDNVTDIYDLESWFTTGDSAPNRRNNYTVSMDVPYEASEENVLVPRTEDAIKFMPPVKLSDDEVRNLKDGLYAESFRLPAKYGKMPDLYLIAANRKDKGESSDISESPFSGLKTNYALRYSGYVEIPEDGEYEFSVSADDCARIYIDGRLLTEIVYDENRQSEKTVTAAGSTLLGKGYHSITVEYAELGNGDASLVLSGDYTFRHIS